MTPAGDAAESRTTEMVVEQENRTSAKPEFSVISGGLSMDQNNLPRSEKDQIHDANVMIANAKNPIVIVTENFLENYGYAALGWFAKGVPFAFENQRARNLVPENYGSWVDEPVNNHPKIFDPVISHEVDKIIIVGKPSAPMERMVEAYSEIKEGKMALHDITPNMRAFNFESLRPESTEPKITMKSDPYAQVDLCRSIRKELPKRPSPRLKRNILGR